MASNAQGGGGSGSSGKRGRKSEGKSKEPRVKQRGMGVAKLEQLRIQDEMADAAANPAVGRIVVVPSNLPVSSIASLSQLHNMRAHEGPYNYLAAVMPPPFSITPMTAPPLAGPQGVKENLSSAMPGDLSTPSLWPTYVSAPSSTPDGLHRPQSTKMGMASEGCNLELGLMSTSKQNEEEADDQEFQQPNYFTKLLLGEDEDDEKETGQKNKKARTDSSAGGSASARSSTSQEPDLDLRLFL